MGLSEHQKTSDTSIKVRLVSFWSEKSSNGATLATWSFLDEKVCTSVGNLPSRNAFEKSEGFSTFSKNKKVTKSHFRVLAYVYDVFWCSEGSESQSCVLSNLERLGAPKSPRSHFLYFSRKNTLFRPQVTQVLQPLCFPRSNQWFWDSKTHFGAPNAFWSNLSTLGAEK